MGNKTVYELKTSSGRSINTTSNHPYLVKLYSKEECDKYIGDVWNKNNSSEFEEKGFCTRWVQVSELKEGYEIVVPRVEDLDERSSIQISFLNNFSINSSVVKTSTNDCCLRCGSLDHIAVAFMLNASARYGESSLSGRAEIDFSSNSSYSEWLQNLILLFTSSCHSSYSCSESLDLDKHSDLCLSISDSMYSGAKNLALSVKNKYEAAESGFIIENFTLASNISLIISPYLLINFSLISGESLASNDLNASFLTFLPNSTDHLVNSFSSLELSFLRNASSSDFLCVLTSSSSIIKCSSLSTFFNLSIIDESFVIDSAILSSPYEYNENDYLNVMSDITFKKITSENKVISPKLLFNVSQELGFNSSLDSSIMHFLVISDKDGVSELSTSNENTVKSANLCLGSNSDSFVQNVNIINNTTMLFDKIRSLEAFFLFACEPCSDGCYLNNSNRRNIFHKSYSLSRILRINSVESSSEIRAFSMSLVNSDRDKTFLCFLGSSNSSMIECSSLSTFLSFFIINDSFINITDTTDAPMIYKDFYNNSDIAFEKITSIKELEEQHVYDLNIENTHNFIANDIIAHNTGTDSATTIQYSFGTFPNISVNTSGLFLTSALTENVAFG